MVLVDDDNHHYARNDFGMFNMLRSPVWIFDIDQKAMYWANRSALYIWNATSLEELLSRDFASDMSDAAWSFLLDTKRKLLLNQVVSEQWTFYPRGLGATTLDINCSAVRIEDGRIAMLLEAEIIGNKRDMTESAVRSIEILKHLPIAVSQFTQEGRLIYQNPQAYHLFGAVSSSSNRREPSSSNADHDPSNSAATSSSDTASQSNTLSEQMPTETSESIILKPDEDENVLLQRFVDLDLGQSALQQIQNGTDFSAEALLYTHPPEPLSSSDRVDVDLPRWFNVLLRRARDPVTSEFVILYIARDIEDIVRARKETTKAALKSEFLDVMAHEIRTPMHQIVGHVDLLEDSVLNKEQLESVQQIQSSSSLLMSIINDLLDCSKLEYGQVQIENVTFALDSVVNGCVASSRPQAQKKNITLTCNIASSCAPYLIADPNRLRQILNNLLSNAVKFTEAGSVSLTVAPCEADSTASLVESASAASQHPNDTTPRQRLRFSVTDTGIGIDAKEQKVIFERYRQANSSVARQFGGTGLGLPICKGLVELMHGTIGLHSEMGRGTTFFFEIPFVVAHPSIKNATKRTAVSDPQVAPQKPPVPSSSAMEVLVVEDNKVNQKVVKSMLQRFGHVVTIAENGQVALNELNQKQFHLILMDIQMPVMDGIECTKYIRNVLHLSKEQMPIVGLTAGFQLSEQSFYENEVGMNSCLGKPLPMDALKNTLACYQPSPPPPKDTRVVNNNTTTAMVETLPIAPKHVLDAETHASISLIPPIDYSAYQIKSLDLTSPKKKQCS
jgi:signal transduction histidine kinase/ActR/RegA family two-component response regulator